MWSVILGPDNQAVSHENWDDFKSRGLLYVWDVYCEKVQHPQFPYYRVWLRRGQGRSKNNMIEVGHTIFYQGWNAFGSHGFMPVDGFMNRHKAIEYMLKCRGFQEIRP